MDFLFHRLHKWIYLPKGETHEFGRQKEPGERQTPRAELLKPLSILDLLAEGREIWGPRPWADTTLNLKAHGLSGIIIKLNVILGDIARWRRDKRRLNPQYEELQKEMGNLIFSTIRWCDDLGFDPEICIEIAIRAQKRFAAELSSQPEEGASWSQ